VAGSDAKTLRKMASDLGVIPVSEDEIGLLASDIYAHCGEDEETSSCDIGQIKASIIYGSGFGDCLYDQDDQLRGDVLFIPDYVANVGGLILCSSLAEGVTDKSTIIERIRGVEETTKAVIHVSRVGGLSTVKAADYLARSILDDSVGLCFQ
jgi:glutamate dehydrogenase/leucine dehydrogenase